MVDSLKNVISDYISQKRIKQKDIQTKSDGKVNQANLSAALNGRRHFTLEMLDAITDALDLPPGYFYRNYISECKDKDGNRLRNKCVEFIVRCYEMDVTYLADPMVNEMIQEGKSNIDAFLKIAEDLSARGYGKHAVKFYDVVIELENDTLSERLANSYYRKFTIVRDWNMELAYDSAVQLLTYLRNVTHDQLEAYRKVIAVFFVSEKWSKVITYSDELAELARIKGDTTKYGEALLYKIRAMYYTKEYTEALKIVEEIIPLEGSFKIWGEGNRYNLMLADGQHNIIGEFVDWLNERKSEIPSYIPSILEVCVNYGMTDKAENIIKKFADEMDGLERKLSKTPFEQRLLARYLLMKAKVLFKNTEYGLAIDTCLDAMDRFTKLKLPNHVLKCVRQLHSHKEHIDTRQMSTLDYLLDLSIETTS